MERIALVNISSTPPISLIFSSRLSLESMAWALASIAAEWGAGACAIAARRRQTRHTRAATVSNPRHTRTSVRVEGRSVFFMTERSLTHSPNGCTFERVEADRLKNGRATLRVTATCDRGHKWG